MWSIFTLSLLVLLTHAGKPKKTELLKQMTRQSLKDAVCIKAKVKSNRRTGTSNVVFKMLDTADDEHGNPSTKEGTYCTPDAKCGVIFFPNNQEHILHALMSAPNLHDPIVDDREVQFAFGSRGKIAKAFLKGAEAASKKLSKYKPLAYMIRRIDHENPSNGIDTRAIRKASLLSKYGIRLTPKSKKNDQQEHFDQIVIPLVGLDPTTSSTMDNVEVLLSEINTHCSTKYRTKRQVLSTELLAEMYADHTDPVASGKSLLNDEGQEELNDDQPSQYVYNQAYALRLLKLGASVNIRSSRGVTPLMRAAEEGDSTMIQRMIKLGGLINLKDVQDRTALHYAIPSHQANPNVVEDLALGGNIQASRGREDFGRMIDGTSESSMLDDQRQPFFVQQVACIHVKDAAGRTPFALLMDQVSHKFYEERPQPSAFAVLGDFLLHVGSDINALNYMQQTPLMLASQRKAYHIVDFLLDHHANVEVKDLHGCTALCHAIEWYSWTVTLAKKFAQIKSKDISKQISAVLELHSFDEIFETCEQKLISNIYNGKKPYLKAEISLVSLTNALLECGFLERSTHLLLNKGNASIGVVNAKGETVLHMMHPTMKKSFYDQLDEQQQVEYRDVLSVHRDNQGVLENQSVWHGFVGETENDSGVPETVHDAVLDNAGNVETEKTETTGTGTDCDFDVISLESLMAMDTSDGKKAGNSTAFEFEYQRWNKPVLVLNFSNVGSDWSELTKAWTNEEWIINNYGSEHITTGTIPYADHFNLISHRRKMQTYLAQIQQYEDTRKKVQAQQQQSQDSDIHPHDLELLSNPPMYLFHLIELLQPKHEMGYALANMFLKSKKTQSKYNPFHMLHKSMVMQSAQFYYGRYGSGAPFHFHGKALNVLLQGRKDWLLSPPSVAMYSRLHPALWKKTMDELRTEYGGGGGGKTRKFYKCTQPQGSLLYVPTGWSHAVLNVDENVPTVGVAVEYATTGSNEIEALLDATEHATEDATEHVATRTTTVHDEFTRRLESTTQWARSLEYADIAMH